MSDRRPDSPMQKANFAGGGVEGQAVVKYRDSAISCAKMTEPIQMLSDAESGGPGNHVLDGRANWCNLSNTNEPFVCAGDAALCQSILTTCCTLHRVTEITFNREILLVSHIYH